jgi:hypothetical protein
LSGEKNFRAMLIPIRIILKLICLKRSKGGELAVGLELKDANQSQQCRG